MEPKGGVLGLGRVDGRWVGGAIGRSWRCDDDEIGDGWEGIMEI